MARGARKRKAANEESARDALEGFAYESSMAQGTCALVTEAEIRKSAYLESFLVHVRNLIEFYRHSPGDGGVAWAGDYTKSKWPPAEAKTIWNDLNRPTPTEATFEERLAVRLSHLGQDRRKYDHEWHPGQIYAQLRKLQTIFIADLKPEHRAVFDRMRGAAPPAKEA